MRVLTLLLITLSSTILAQFIYDFGNVRMEELRMTTYAPDTSAAAVILFDHGETTVDGLGYKFTRHMRLKILKKSGLNWGDFRTIVPRSLRINDIKGSTYNIKGESFEETKMKPDAIHKRKLNRDFDAIVLSLPNVTVGSVIEFSYDVNGNAFLTDWTFQYTIPSIISQYSTDVTNLIKAQRELRGSLKLTQSTFDKARAYQNFVMRDVPAFKLEPFIKTPEDYISKIHFNLGAKNWGLAARSVYINPYFGEQLEKSKFLNDTVSELTDSIKTPQNKLKVIYDYVKASISWDQKTDRIPDRKFKEVMESKIGSSSEINLILVCMLRKAGLHADPVFSRTRNLGKVWTESTQIAQFNDIFCHVNLDGKRILLDATDKDLPMSVLPERCLNNLGMVYSGNELTWIEIAPSKSTEVYNCELLLDESGDLRGSLKISRSGLVAGRARRRYRLVGEEKYIDSLFNKKNWDVTAPKFSNMNDTKESVKENYELEIHDRATTTSSTMYITPIVTERIEENPFKSETRIFPVNILPYEKVFSAKIKIPDSYEVEELPKPKLITLPGGAGKFAFNIVRANNTISITSQLSITKELFIPEEYPALRELYNIVVAKQMEQIVLKRK